MKHPKFKVALIQLHVGMDKSQNVARAVEMIGRAVEEGKADLVVLPESFNSPYGGAYFDKYAEPIDNSETLDAIAEAAKAHGVTVVAGSIPTRDTSGKTTREDGSPALYNTSVTFDREGHRVATYHKVHLFDVDIPGGITFFESHSLSPGNALTTFETSKQSELNGVRFGVGICFDVRFTEMFSLYQHMGCQVFIVPAAFNTTTGPLHWELLARARAVDNQAYVLMCSPARVEGASYQAWGHSMAVDPWGKILCEASEKEEIVYADIDLAVAHAFRQQVPTIANRRHDMYEVVLKKECAVNGRPIL